MTQREYDKKFNELNVQLAEAEKRAQEIRDELDELNNVKIEPESRRWKPNGGQTYYFVSDTGIVTCTTWYNSNVDLSRFAIGNVFKIRKEAEFEYERLKVIAELKEFAEPDDTEWDEYHLHYSIYYNNYFKTVEGRFGSLMKHPSIYFESKEKVKEAVKAVGEDRIKKYYLRVKGYSGATYEVEKCEEKQKEVEDEINIGDEVISKSNYYYIVTGIKDDTAYCCIDDNGDAAPRYFEKTELKKTGRHFPQIEEVFKQMKGVQS